MNYPVLDLSFKVCLCGSPLLMHKYLQMHRTMNILLKRHIKHIKKPKNMSVVGREKPRSEAEDLFGIDTSVFPARFCETAVGGPQTL